MFRIIRYIFSSKWDQCVKFHGGHALPKYTSADEFKDFHRGQNEMYVRHYFRCAHCGSKICNAVRLPQDFTDRCDETYPFPWFPRKLEQEPTP